MSRAKETANPLSYTQLKSHFQVYKCIQGVLVGTIITFVYVLIHIWQLLSVNNDMIISKVVTTFFSFGATLLYFIPHWMILMLTGTLVVLLLDKKLMQKKRRTPLFVSNVLLTIPLGIAAILMTAVIYLTAVAMFLRAVGGIRS